MGQCHEINNNGVLEVGEDINGNNSPKPTNPATITKHPPETPTVATGTGKLTTDSSGLFSHHISKFRSPLGPPWINSDCCRYSHCIADASDLAIEPADRRNRKYGTSVNCNDAL